ncbi:GH25 family lysozyme [Terrisporobacter glycolicus]|uniref:Autolytic lysozyme n=1 Tax=Terrisporobacter glycolicus ATCC 14880 = DSM 1288 TaxID=1121315 RepID=A0ABZ2EW75_9FIRM|nr:GH25 family lysozyme [Terrisporobacter glycolicus]
MATIKGIDVSKHNGNINWKKVKDDGIKFVIIRAGYGSSTVDEKFEEYIKGAIEEGIDIGIYWFSYAISEEKAKLEAVKCMEVIKPYKDKITYPVFYDFEYDSVSYAKKQGVSINKTKATAFAYSFLKEIEKGGYIPGLYTNIDFSNNYFFKSLQRDYDLWIAQYASRCSYSESHVMWQYSESGRVSGIDGDTDLDYCYKKYSSKGDNDNTNKDKEDSISKILIKSLQNALNESYNCNLAEDGIFGPKTKAAVEIHPLSIKDKDKKLEHTKWLQKALKELGYDIAVDGYFGKDTQATVEKYQKKKNLTIDGIAGIKTHESIISYI